MSYLQKRSILILFAEFEKVFDLDMRLPKVTLPDGFKLSGEKLFIRGIARSVTKNLGVAHKPIFKQN